jgi:hypothetical protein
MRNAQQALGEIPTPKTIFNKETGEKVETQITDVDRPAANKALELLGRTLGQFIDRHEVGQPGEFERMTTDELRQYVAERAAQISASIEGAGDKATSGTSRKQLN